MLSDRDLLYSLMQFLAGCAGMAHREEKKILELERLLDDHFEKIQIMSDKAAALTAMVELYLRRSGIAPITVEGPGPEPPPPRIPFAMHLRVEHNPVARGWQVWIDFPKEPFVVQDQVGLFLDFISKGEAPKQGGLAAYRTLDELLEHLKETKCNAKHPLRYINVLVNKARSALDKAKQNPDLVQRDAAGGVRFAVRRPPFSSR